MLRRLRTAFGKYWARWLLALVLAGMAEAVVMNVLPNRLVERLDLFFYDLRMRVTQPDLDPRIVIIDIDEKSIAELGRWPWSRDVVAQLVKQMTQTYQAQSVGFDVVFAEPDNTSGYGRLEDLARGPLKDVPQLAQQLRLLKPQMDYDARLAAALQGQPVVMGYAFSSEPGAVTKGQLPPPAFSLADLGGRDLDVIGWRAYGANLPQLQAAARAGGFFNQVPGDDGLVRAVPLIARYGNQFYESLALATARVAVDGKRIKPVFLTTADGLMESQKYDYGALAGIAVEARPQALFIPVERGLTTLVTYRGAGGPNGGAFRYVPAVDVIRGTYPHEQLDGRIMLVGTTVPGLNDLRATPVNSIYPGVEIHANLIASILDDDFKSRPDFAQGYDALQVALVGLLLGLLLPMLGPLASMLLALGSAAALGGLNLWLYNGAGMVLPLATSILLVLLLFISNLAWGYLFEYRNRKAIVNLFGEYVAPELVAEMAANPASYNMEGEIRELSVMFSDVRGFTTISESLQPNELREYINVYLTAMSEDIRGNRGTLDKYIGDAVMAFWGAPLDVPDHAARAVATALKMQQTTLQLNQEFTRRNWPPLKIGIGINSGQMRVGDMGSKIRRAYTVMGDAVNLSSRLEAITKVYGVGVLVGQATRLAAPQFAYRELDRVRVKGKNEPVPIYEPLALDTELDVAMRAEVEQWHEALALVRAQRWDEAQAVLQALQAVQSRGLYTLYLERIARYREVPPPADWDGVTTFETK
ncbi:adenylate cyclase [Herbaspirillum rubrisubalbicans]|uniref:Adenylate/guanylate cyclase domain-containing protein n=1 Tax=Herbaspirillum rubrisubalbicans Os34 TaxID=1235827 RepID=A0A6M3ZJX9_9BURK|nr:adenylate/guanylate cyclase domain-containing protein [Herbaspirillum rubrisubalbicans]MCP1575650.1 adenylate cyclase [Herbaspirillum rubrisubalbicans]NQE50489.1 guanylate cyclase [Herbaspirillum rubrisubalbicans]QJP98973.1 adenylate/guanylate cyclase domain-containing protein [Herbaspirillum rubrisubalbicans Os34]